MQMELTLGNCKFTGKRTAFSRFLGTKAEEDCMILLYLLVMIDIAGLMLKATEVLRKLRDLEEGHAYLQATPRGIIAGSGPIPAKEMTSGAHADSLWPAWITKAMKMVFKSKRH